MPEDLTGDATPNLPIDPQYTQIGINTNHKVTFERRLLNADEPAPLPIESAPDGNIEAVDKDEEPPLKRRKVADTPNPQKSLFRTVSPPWKRVAADGPTTFVENGRRKSGRTNLIPLELQPQSEKRQTRAAFDKVSEDKGKQPKPSYKISRKSVKLEVQETKVNPTNAAVRAKAPARRGPGRPPGRRPGRPPLSGKGQATQDSHKRDNKPLKYRKHSTSLSRIPNEPPLGHTGRNKITNGHKRTISSISNNRPGHHPSINRFVKTESLESEEDEEDEEDEEEDEISSDSSSVVSGPPLKLQKIRFRLRPPKPSIQTPANIPLPKTYASFDAFFDNDELEPRSGQDLLTPRQISKEAMARYKLNKARRSGRSLNNNLARFAPDPQPEPDRQFAHHDHLLAHIGHFRSLLKKEHDAHKRAAFHLAREAQKAVLNKIQGSRVKTKEEIEKEQYERTRETYRSVARDLSRQWLGVESEINKRREVLWEQQQEARGKEHLSRVLEQSEQMLESSMRRQWSDDGSDSSENSDSEGDSDAQASSGDEDNMSTSATDSEADEEMPDVDASISLEELRQKYPDLPKSSNLNSELDLENESEVVAEQSEEDSDPSIDMDSDADTASDESSVTDGEQEETTDDIGEEEAESDTDSVAGVGLLGFFNKAQLGKLTQDTPSADSNRTMEPLAEEAESVLPSDGKPDDEEIARGVATSDDLLEGQDYSTINFNRMNSRARAHSMQSSADGRTSQEPSTQASPRTSLTKASEPESTSSLDPHSEQHLPGVPVPSLLKGTLRKYQHEGLDWLAGLYATGRSAILADEMGLGKTIQSISLLAHLAVHHEIWGPHLIIVPTTVILNWEMEFKKFCPGFKVLSYYGNQEERKAKRRGWSAPDFFNVCITSYELAKRDQGAFRRRPWHYMILDEAHKIKNWQSQTWQITRGFNTRARLLLTGTPVQNDLNELWALLTFLRSGDEADGDDSGFASLQEWARWTKRPVESILEHGQRPMDEEDKEQVLKLQKVIRPFFLRRLKKDVEKQMPAKYEHVIRCRLSKRQRQLYDGFMSRAQTKDTLASGNSIAIANVMMQLRKVCNHPDLFETRPITTSFAMTKSAVADFEIRDLIVRRALLSGKNDTVNLDFLQLVPISREDKSVVETAESARLIAYHKLARLRDLQRRRTSNDFEPSGQDVGSVLSSLKNVARLQRLAEIDRLMYSESYRHRQHPVFGRGLLQKLTIVTKSQDLSPPVGGQYLPKHWETWKPATSLDLVQLVETRATKLLPLVQRFACVTPAVVAPGLIQTALSEAEVREIRNSQLQWPSDPFHEARVRLSIAFPDKRLLQYDCGKLQRLDKLLRELQAGGHRALIFTQFTTVLNILEQFLNIHGNLYLRLDGATKIEQRQLLTDRFNNDTRIPVFILSARAGGLGINLTGADTVIFYDIDWNPAMDAQCTDRAHRIGQTRDVHIYRFVSEHTIETNILRKANQKRMLDDVVIQEGDFTTQYLDRRHARALDDEEAADDYAEASAVFDRVLGNERLGMAALEQAEDKDDAAAAKVAEKEVQIADDGDFEDLQEESAGAFGSAAATDAVLAENHSDNEGVHHIDEYMLRFREWSVKDIPLGPARARIKKIKKRIGDHRSRMR